MKRTFKINDISRRHAMIAVRDAQPGYVVTVSPPTRSLDQNAKLWPMLGDVAGQVVWYGQKLNSDEWKDVFTAALVKAKVIPGIDGGFVVCGQRTSTMPKQQFSDLIELIYSFGAEHGVKWSEPALFAFAEQRAA
jgi:hypothetical protein